jgi:hypothetical protein
MTSGVEALGEPSTDGLGVRERFERVRPVADAVLYEGYLLYPYRRSSPKNRIRWQFGVLAPRAWVEADGPVPVGVAGSVESWYQQTELLLQAPREATVQVRVRYLQVQRKRVERRLAGGRFREVASVELDDSVQLSFDEAVARETDLVAPLAELTERTLEFGAGAPGGQEIEVLPGGDARVVRVREPIEAVATLRAEPLDASRGLYRVRLRIENTWRGTGAEVSREEALRHALLATHSFSGVDEGRFLSLADPPSWARDAARDCRQAFAFPVLADAADQVALAAPIILEDHPQIAPESPGDLHDAAEIDEILSLRTLLLTDAEKREARATDPRAAAILDRVEAMPPKAFARLHGRIRSRRPAAPDGTPTRVLVDGVPIGAGSRVVLRPRSRGTDAQDMFLAGRSAEVREIREDVDGSVHLAVTVDDDPGADLHGWYGRYRYFRLDEVEPSPSRADTEV